jgi:hypothetical protein
VRFFFGAPGENLVSLYLPYRMRLAWDPHVEVHRFTCHEKVHDAFLNVFADALRHYGLDRIKELRLDWFGGCYNNRFKRGGTQLSMHAWGIAVDLDPERNQLRQHHDTAEFAKADYEPFWKIVEAQGLVSLGRTHDFDWMHFQAARTR